jgi:hypothetical protein
VPLGADGVGIGIDLSSWDVLAQNPWRQLGAALLDAGTVWAAGAGVNKLSDSGGNSDSGRNNVRVNVANDSGRVEVNVNGSGDGGSGASGPNRDNNNSSN